MKKNYITTQAMTYNTRRLKAGDPLRLPRHEGDLLVKIGRLQEVPAALAQDGPAFKVPPPPKPPKAVAAPAAVVTPESEASAAVTTDATVTPPVEVYQAAATSDRGEALTAARDEYERVVGKKWFHGWDETELRKRIAEHNDP